MHWTVLFIYAIADARDISIRELERKSEVSMNTICRWKDQNRTPDFRTVEKVLKSLGYRLKIEKI